MLRPEITQHSARDAFEQAGIGPQDVDVVELHDAFSIAELVYYEALGLCEDGESASFLRSEEHTSELQSLMRISYAVFCLKKKINNTRPHKPHQMPLPIHRSNKPHDNLTQSHLHDH